MIRIYKNPNGDTRTATKDVTFKQFQEANDMHIYDVKDVMYELSCMVDSAGEHHDCTKKAKKECFTEILNLPLRKERILSAENGISFMLRLKDIICCRTVQTM